MLARLYYRTVLLVEDNTEVGNQSFASCGCQINTLGVDEQVTKGLDTRPSLVDIGHEAFSTRDIGVVQAGEERIPVLDEREGSLLSLKPGTAQSGLAGDGTISGFLIGSTDDQLLDARVDEVSKDGEGFGRVLGAFPDSEGISINTTSNLAVETDRHDAEVEFATGLGQVGNAAQVPGRHVNHGNLATGHDVTTAEIGTTGYSAVRDKGLFAPNAIIDPLPGLLPAIRDRCGISTLGATGDAEVGHHWT